MIEREIDNVGRVVIPMEFRKKLGIEFNSKVLISLSNGSIIIKAQKETCALCGSKLEEIKEVRLCSQCIVRVKEIKD